ncbi:hypothetical protein C2845_PM07G30420 [Panicum miliaceum]|uniref:Uncharacterized protein n=1 Tax=Panicum miliaceum TaxID=4540 RepID=A0A3L6SSK7_PANMI|nr:hypothetical protein C2845_PM07G30420 [Panicum miliaceum]
MRGREKRGRKMARAPNTLHLDARRTRIDLGLSDLMHDVLNCCAIAGQEGDDGHVQGYWRTPASARTGQQDARRWEPDHEQEPRDGHGVRGGHRGEADGARGGVGGGGKACSLSEARNEVEAGARALTGRLAGSSGPVPVSCEWQSERSCCLGSWTWKRLRCAPVHRVMAMPDVHVRWHAGE